jgi:hypothetical protein
LSQSQMRQEENIWRIYPSPEVALFYGPLKREVHLIV